MSSSSPEMPNLGRYQVVDRIAAGGMAEVFLARAVGAMGFQRLVALKLIHSNFTRDPEFVKMFIDEARIAMHLHHRNIVQVFDLDEVGGTYFLAMEYVKGVNLYDLYERIAARDRWIEVPMALYLVAEICKGLHFAHTRTGAHGRPLGIIHRDISPQNILLSFEGEVKITDFGIATAAERLHQTAAGIVKGKYAYMAPERLKEAPADARVDVFSAGVLLYELLVGENPFAGSSAVETIEAVLGTEVAAPSRKGAPSPKRLDEICLRALAKRPEDRYPSAQALADDLTELAMGLTYARKDMASGDAAVANLLAELFPQERAKPVGNQDVRGLALPGVSAPPSDTTDPEDTAQPFQVPSEPEEETPDDLDAPTLLRPGFDDRRPPPADSTGANLQTGDPTVQVEPVSAADLARLNPAGHDDDDDDDPFAATLPAGTAETMEMNAISQADLRGPRPPSFVPTSRPPVPLSSEPREAIPLDPAETQRSAGTPLPLPRRGPPAMVESDHPPSTDLELVRRAPGGAVRRWLMPALIGLAAVMSIVVVVVVLDGGTQMVVEVPISVRSVPPGARVEVNGRALPDPTPTQTTVLAGRAVEVQVSLDGYRSHVETVFPDERQASAILVSLEPVAAPPPLEVAPRSRKVTLRPKTGRWAHVYRDGEDLGPTPVTVELPVGTTRLEVVPKDRRKRLKVDVEVPPSGPDVLLLQL